MSSRSSIQSRRIEIAPLSADGLRDVPMAHVPHLHDLQQVAVAERDRLAIMRVVEEETAAYFDKDYERWARCWVQEDYGRRWMWFARGGVTLREGWTEHGPRMKAAMTEFPVPSASGRDIRRENINLRVGADMAWMTFDQYGPRGDEPFDVPGLQKELRILEKHEGEWKIAACCVLQRSLDHIRAPLVKVDAQGRVLWSNNAASELLRQGSVISAIGGRLRATVRAADQRLQAAVRWAAAVNENAQWAICAAHASLPVVLDSGDDEPPTVCWVIADSEMILVSINDQRVTEERLQAASVVYGFSPAQLRLAALIVGGHDLVGSADAMKVSVNTVRTHLQRIFEKTGVRSQPALVRALLSFTSHVG
jgi:DNA-binding CsgD family transcriptional regulator